MRIDLRFQQGNLHFAVFQVEFTLFLFLSLKTFKIPDNVIYTHRDDVLVMEMQAFPSQQAYQVVLPYIPSNKAFYIVFQVIGNGTHDQKVHHGTHQMACNLKVDAKSEEPVAVEKNADN